MRGVPLLTGFAIALAAGGAAGCGDSLRCGAGTVEKGGACVAALPLPPCDTDGGATVIGGLCVPAGAGPLFCGPGTSWDPASGRCVGSGTGPSGCAGMCSAPDQTHVCVTGQVASFVDPSQKAAPTAQSGLKVRVYEPLSFATNPAGAVPLAESDIEDQGCYLADAVARTQTGLVALSVTDVDNALGGRYAVTGVGATLQPDRNVSDLHAYFLERSTVDAWQAQIGAGTPAGCANSTSGLVPCGMWLGVYLDALGSPVAGVRPTRPGSDPASSTIFCFQGDRLHLGVTDETDDTGLCILSPDIISPHGGVCGPQGCTCGGVACTPVFTAAIAGTAQGVLFIQPFVALP